MCVHVCFAAVSFGSIFRGGGEKSPRPSPPLSVLKPPLSPAPSSGGHTYAPRAVLSALAGRSPTSGAFSPAP
jgi:hypothetical protein